VTESVALPPDEGDRHGTQKEKAGSSEVPGMSEEHDRDSRLSETPGAEDLRMSAMRVRREAGHGKARGRRRIRPPQMSVARLPQVPMNLAPMLPGQAIWRTAFSNATGAGIFWSSRNKAAPACWRHARWGHLWGTFQYDSDRPSIRPAPLPHRRCSVLLAWAFSAAIVLI
jgi:hypothetical protein